MIDIGINLTNNRFADDHQTVITQALEVGVEQMIITGTSLANSMAAAKMAADYPSTLFATAGVHPHDAKDFQEEDMKSLVGLLKLPQVVAMGECGLDFNRNFSPPEVQIEVFRQQVQTAVDTRMPLFVHERDAASTVLSVLSEFPKCPPVVIHCFTGDAQTLSAYVERDYYIGITGWICDPTRGKHLWDIVDYIPSNRLMIETDSPYLLPKILSPKPRNNRNEPKYLGAVAEKIAECLGEDVANLKRRTTENARRFFNLPEALGEVTSSPSGNE